MAPSGAKRMGFLVVLLCVVFIKTVQANEQLGFTVENPQQIPKPNSTEASQDTGKASFDEQSAEHSRKSRAVPAIQNIADSESVEEEHLLDTDDDNIHSTLLSSKFVESQNKRGIPNLRFGRSGTSLLPTLRFGRSGTSIIPSIRFGRSASSMIPSIRFGRSGSSMIPSIRFGRSGSSMIPSIRFGRSFETDGGAILESDGNLETETNADDNLLDYDVVYEDIGSTDNDDDDFSTINEEIYSQPLKKTSHDSGSVIPYPRFGRETGTDSRETTNSLALIYSRLKRQTNDSIIPQIRYGRSSLKTKKVKDVKPPSFILPNIRPGRSSSDGLEIQEGTSSPYFADVDGFLGLFGAFRRSDGDVIDDSINLKEMELSSKFEDLLNESDQETTDEVYETLEEQPVKSNKDTLYVIPYPRPGKRQFDVNQLLQNGNPVKGSKDQAKFFKENKISDYMLPYPRPGKRMGSNFEYTRSKRSSIPYPRPGRSSSILPYPRLGRSGSVVPYPRMGRSNSILPYPRLGRSGSVLPYPRMGRSSSILPYPRLGRSGSVLPYPRLGRSASISTHSESGGYSNILPYPRPGRSSKDGNYMLPYPRPGRTPKSSSDKKKKLIFRLKNNELNQIGTQNEELKREKRRSGETYPLSKEIFENVSTDLLQTPFSKEMDGRSDVNESLRKILVNIMKGPEKSNNPIYILPYPRPGRDI